VTAAGKLTFIARVGGGDQRKLPRVVAHPPCSTNFPGLYSNLLEINFLSRVGFLRLDFVAACF
jgi:hypothetical protein